MSGFLAGLAMRGAGLPHSSTPVLVPRGRARFEPLAGLGDTDAIAPEFQAELSGPDETRTRAAGAMPTPPGRPPDRLPEVSPPADVGPSAMPRTADPAMPSPAGPQMSPAQPGMPPASNRLPGPMPLSSEPLHQAVAAQIVPATTPPGPARQVAADAPGAPPAVAVIAPDRPLRDPIQILLDHIAPDPDLVERPMTPGPPETSPTVHPLVRFPEQPAPDPPAAPGVTVSIDRIQVIVEAPPPSTAATARYVINPIGFADYARARRGMPR